MIALRFSFFTTNIIIYQKRYFINATNKKWLKKSIFNHFVQTYAFIVPTSLWPA